MTKVSLASPRGDKTSSPIALIAAHAKQVAIVCDLLEAIADNLPSPASGACAEAERLCKFEVPRHFHELTVALIPLLKERAQDPVNLKQLDQMSRDIAEETEGLGELLEILSSIQQHDKHKLSSEALGYALRGFFDSMRRQLNWEENVLLPMADELLSDKDLVCLQNHVCFDETMSKASSKGTRLN